MTSTVYCRWLYIHYRAVLMNKWNDADKVPTHSRLSEIDATNKILFNKLKHFTMGRIINYLSEPYT